MCHAWSIKFKYAEVLWWTSKPPVNKTYICICFPTKLFCKSYRLLDKKQYGFGMICGRVNDANFHLQQNHSFKICLNILIAVSPDCVIVLESHVYSHKLEAWWSVCLCMCVCMCVFIRAGVNWWAPKSH